MTHAVVETIMVQGDSNRRLHPKHEHLFSKLDDYRLIRPYRSTADGGFLTHVLSTEIEEDRLEYLRIKRDEERHRRRRRDVNDESDVFVEEGDGVDEADPVFHFSMEAFGAHLVLNVSRFTRLVSPRFRVERYLDDGSVETFTPRTNCFYKGVVSNTTVSRVAISNCQGLSGYIQTDDDEYVIEPLEADDETAFNLTEGHLHVLYRRRDFRSNSTGLGTASGTTFSSNLVNDTDTNLSDFDLEDDDYNRLAEESATPRHREKRRSRSRYAAGRQNFVETMITVDHAMHSFHGGGAVNIYLITMIHIVNTAYEHHTLDANIQFVVVRIVLLNKQQSRYMVVENNAPASLTNVCRWAATQTTRDDSAPEHHDHAIFVTKENFGPAGYAPVTGMCAITRSCSLNKDEGLLSSFVIAHESGHVFGMEHDGQGNACEDDATRGSIMAPVVISTYIHYFWSKCSRRELHRYLSRYYCLWDDPFDGGYPEIRGYPGQRYTMDEQCRFDFGHGYRTCTAFNDYNRCEQLWCMHPRKKYLCRSKKGPPLDGSTCGPGMWCVQGRCRYSQNQIDGHWSAWSQWSECPYTCGTGAQYRSRTCDNPRPQYGGRDCVGKAEEYRLCNTRECPGGPVDKRAEQCLAFFTNWVHRSKRHVWLPYENRNKTLRCRLTCASEETGEVAMSEYNVTDGTPFSYDNPESICIQGKQVSVGCDNRLGSNVKFDKCGECGGDGSSCKRVKLDISDDASKKRRYKKIFLLMPAIRSVDIKKTVSSSHFLAIKTADSGKYILNPGRRRSEPRDFVIDGARFSYDVSDNRERLVSKGPIGKELYLMAYITRDTNTLNYSVTYFESRNSAVTPDPGSSVDVAFDGNTHTGNTPPIVNVIDPSIGPDEPEYEWREVGWTKCNRKCGGGYSFFRHQCFRRATSVTVKKSFCGMDDYNPKGQRKRCNKHECGTSPSQDATTSQPPIPRSRDGVEPTTRLPTTTTQPPTTTEPPTTLPPSTFEWSILDWGECSETCGINGFRRREVQCVEVRDEERTGVDPSMCLPPQPSDNEACNRGPCPADWVTGTWSECSATCGTGTKTRSVTCETADGGGVPGSFHCFAERPPSSKSCEMDPCAPGECQPLDSVICKRNKYRIYCKMPRYEEICCTTCKKQKQLLRRQRSGNREA
ncbi:A disintegrin and metalloproteinase with thrombospondin motifs 3-like [Diadema setosum]|uniref:A disintegrin and metalloproteinase with thrombospondin motifs 3-like n=1 Tax=Diadema setosum TaxID=31175 RepID=UPI003B3B90EC